MLDLGAPGKCLGLGLGAHVVSRFGFRYPTPRSAQAKYQLAAEDFYVLDR